MTQTKRILILAENNYEDQELWYPKLRFTEAGYQVKVAGVGEKSYKSKYGYPVETDGSVADFNPDDFDGVVVPGGWAPDRLRRHKEVLQFVRQICESGKLVAAICHGGWVLASANIVRGRALTSVNAIRDDLANAGAKWIDQPCVVDGNLVTAQVPKDLPEFMRACLRVASKAQVSATA